MGTHTFPPVWCLYQKKKCWSSQTHDVGTMHFFQNYSCPYVLGLCCATNPVNVIHQIICTSCFIACDSPTTSIGSCSERQNLTNRLVDRAVAYRMEASTETSKIMINSTNNISADISMNGQELEEVTTFKYMEAILCKDGACSAVHQHWQQWPD